MTILGEHTIMSHTSNATRGFVRYLYAEEERLHQEATQKAEESIEEIANIQNQWSDEGGEPAWWLSGNDLRKLNEAIDELREAIMMFNFVRASRIQLYVKIERLAEVEI